MTKWVLVKEPANIQLMAETLKISETMAQVMVNRNVRTRNTALRFLNPELAFLHDPFLMKDMLEAIKLIVKTVANGERIVIYGDYDVDGVMSTVILLKTLAQYGADVSFYMPDREEEGYGLNMQAIQTLDEADVKLLITCDNGIASTAEILEAKMRDMRVIVFDHHEPGFMETPDGVKTDIIPRADAVIDPKRTVCAYPFKALCAASVAYKFSKAFHDMMDIPFENDGEFLVLAMIATFCDIVDLQGENRIIVKHGLDILNHNKAVNIGLRALISEKGYGDKAIDSFVVGFILGPCINAAGRLKQASLAVELLTTEHEQRALELARQMVELNEIRKKMTMDSYENAVQLAEVSGVSKDAVMVLLDPDTHESIAGIVAGRLKEHYHKPVVMLTKSHEWVKGSARSIEVYNIFEAMFACKDLFERFGGHPMAAGVTLRPENVSVFRERLNASCTLTEDDFVEMIKIDKQLSLSEVTYELAEELKMLAPFGKANKEPVFLSKGLCPEQLRVIEEKDTLIFTFRVDNTSRRVKGICFGHVERFKEKLSALYNEDECAKILNGVLRDTNLTMDMVYTLEINEYNDYVGVQMRIKDFIVNR